MHAMQQSAIRAHVERIKTTREWANEGAPDDYTLDQEDDWIDSRVAVLDRIMGDLPALEAASIRDVVCKAEVLLFNLQEAAAIAATAGELADVALLVSIIRDLNRLRDRHQVAPAQVQ